MTARRLMIAMLVLLAISVALLALVPTRESNEDTVGSTETAPSGRGGGETEETTASGPEDTFDPLSEPQTATISADRKKTFPVVPIYLGEQLSLVVCSKRTDQVEIPALGLTDTVAPDAPARFELFPQKPDDLGVRLVGAGRVIARIEVRSGAREKSGRPGSKSQPEPGQC
jgi:hypothetical protein